MNKIFKVIWNPVMLPTY
ncbi:hypothetical protein EQ821_26795 [Escherichia coli]|nr:hypothetical protein EQ821_26795 [Escherichia coli]